MAHRSITDGNRWDGARREIRFIQAALAQCEPHAKLVGPLTQLLQTWTEIDQERQSADDALVDAGAAIQALLQALDQTLRELATRLLYEAKKDADLSRFHKFFPEARTAVIRLGLQSELQRIQHFALAANESGVSSEVQAIVAEIALLEHKGNQALKAREQAVHKNAQVWLYMQSWQENALAARRSIELTLQAFAAEHSLADSYVQGFFLTFQNSSRRSSAKPSDPPRAGG